VRITLNRGPAGWGAVLPNKKHEFFAGWRAAQKGGPAGCTTGWASGLHIKLGCGKGRTGELSFSAARPTLFCSPTDCLFCAARPSVLCATAHQKFTFSIWKHSPPGPPAFQLVLSPRVSAT